MGEVPKRGLRIAIEGCGHGELDKIYETMQYLERKEGKKIDLLICCGDFQAVRNMDDLECMACPPKYRHIATFYKYYSGQVKPPYPTLFIGGNHEAANYLWELYYGGWAAPDIMFLGYAGVVRFGGIRIGGLSGIYKDQHYALGHFEQPPYNPGSLRSAYHIRELEVHRLLRLRQPLDVFLSHDWPQGIARHGDLNRLLQRKGFLRREIEDNSLGSPPAAQLLGALQPAYWFSAHLHTKFAALVVHDQQQQQQQGPAGQQWQQQQAAPAPAGQQQQEQQQQGPRSTRFLSLDKCLPGRSFLQVVDFPDADGPLEFSYDPEWLAVLRATHGLLSLQRRAVPLPGPRHQRPPPVGAEEVADVVRRLEERNGGLAVPRNFVPTAPAFDPSAPHMRTGRMPQHAVRNPQTEAFLDLLGLPYNLDHQAAGAAGGMAGPAPAGRWPAMPPRGPAMAAMAAAGVPNPEEIELDDDDDLAGAEDDFVDDDGEEGQQQQQQQPAVDAALAAVLQHSQGPPAAAAAAAVAAAASNPEEIDLGDED